jgi:uncharacterized protein (TIRG00374 family)
MNNIDTPTGQSEKLNTKSWLLFFIFFILVLIFVIYYFNEIKKDLLLLKKVNFYWLILAIIAQILTYFFTAIIYRLLIRACKLKQMPRLSDVFEASIIAQFFNQVIPGAQLSGNTFIFNFLIKLRIGAVQVVSLILTELLTFYAAMEITTLLLLSACLSIYKVPNAFEITLGAGAVVYLVFGFLVALAGRKKFLNILYGKITKIKIIKKWFQNINNSINKSKVSNNDIQLPVFLKRNKKPVAEAFTCQIFVIASDALTIYALFNGLGITVSPYTILLGLVSTKIISTLPFLPGALILYESSMSFFFVSLGVPLGPAIMITLLYRLLSFWFPIPVGLFLYRRWLQRPAVPFNSPTSRIT